MKLFLFYLFFLVSLGSSAQLSLQAKEDLENYKSRSSFIKVRSKTTFKEESYLGGLLTVDNKFDPSLFHKFGVQVGVKGTTVYSVRIPLSKLSEFVKQPGVVFFEVNRHIRTCLDSVRSQVNVDSAYNKLGNIPKRYTGEGVVIGIVDLGIQTNHPMFYDTENNRCRIVRVWDQLSYAGTPPSPYGYGTEYTTEEEILNLQLTTNAKDDAHGTHVSGIAAGSGGKGSNSIYRGIAPKSDIVFVDYGNTANGIIDGIQYIFDYAKQQGKPAVVNLSFGTHIGPHDGTSAFDKLLEDMVSPGYLVVGAAGNEGNLNIHAKHNFNQDEEIRVAISSQKLSIPGSILAQSSSSSLQVGFEIWKPTTLWRYEKIGKTMVGKSVNTVLQDGNNIVSVNAEVKPHGDGEYTEYRIYRTSLEMEVVMVIKQSQGLVHVWVEGDATLKKLPNAEGGGTWMNVDSEYTIGEIGGTSKSIIAVGAVNSKNRGPLYEVSEFSSRGPTADMRSKPDVMAPGATVVSSLSDAWKTDHSWGRDRVYKESDRDSYFGASHGTSMAAPVVTGMVALMLQGDPTLDHKTAKRLIQKYADLIPALTKFPETRRGKGRVNIYRTLVNLSDREQKDDTLAENVEDEELEDETSKENPFATSIPQDFFQTKERGTPIQIIPNPNKGVFSIRELPTNISLELQLFTLSGVLVFQGTFDSSDYITIPSRKEGFYIVRVIQSGTLFYGKTYLY